MTLVRPPPGAAVPSRPYGLRFGRRPRRPRAGRPRRAHLRRGPARRRAGREGLGRRPARRGRGRRVPGGRGRPARRSWPSSPRARTPGWASWWTTWCPGTKEWRIARGGDERARAGRRPPVHRHLGGGEAVVPGHRGVAAGPARPGLEDGRVPGAGLARRTPAAVWQAILKRVRLLQGPGAGAAGPGGGADRLRHGAWVRRVAGPPRLVAAPRSGGRGPSGQAGRSGARPSRGRGARRALRGPRQSTRSRTTASASSRPRSVSTARPAA